MGQVNCQCQEILTDPVEYRPSAPKTNRLLPHQDHTEHLQTRLTLTNPRASLILHLKEAQNLTLGTTPDSLHPYPGFEQPGNAFKVALRMNGRALMAKDCGVGFGVFVVRNKLYLRPSQQEVLLSVEDKLVMLQLSSKKVSWTVYEPSPEGQKSHTAEVTGSEVEVRVSSEVLLVLRRQKSGQEFGLRRKDRKAVCLLLGEETRVKLNDTLRLGCEYFVLGGILTCVDPSCARIEQE